MKFRDPETGEFKELYAKAADTLPVGTVVDFDGTEIPAGWEKVDNILWENPNPTNENGFQPQTITLNQDISNYKYYEVKYLNWYGHNYMFSTGKIPTEWLVRLTAISTDVLYRNMTSLSGKSATFDNCIYIGQSDNYSNTNCIPYQIIGYK
jgi:hypothetical protein